jgi:hypothetical protein
MEGFKSQEDLEPPGSECRGRREREKLMPRLPVWTTGFISILLTEKNIFRRE